MRKKSAKRAAALFMAMALTFTSVGVQSITAKAEQTETVEENILKLDMDENGYLTPTEESQEMLTKLGDESLENQKFSWDNVTAYFVLTDRFLNGDSSNDNSYGRGLNKDGSPMTGLNYKTNPGTFHGGDLKGLTSKVTDGYFNELGVNAIWITAPYEQIHGFTSGNDEGGNAEGSNGKGFPYYSYHGYWTLDYTNIDANMGTAKDFETFVDSCHEKGIRVIMDIVLNHTGYITIKDCIDLGMTDAINSSAEAYYYGNVNNLSGGGVESKKYYNLNSDDWANKWWGTKFVRVSSDYKGYQNVGESAGLTSTLCGLPDVYTESTTEVPLPPHLKNMWTAQGRYEKEVAELDAFFQKTNLPRTPRNYIVKWLTDYVREYGVDGFRCDTAAHVDLESWKVLKEQSVAALKEWRENNKGKKPGADWTDEFWMTGESWGHGVNKDDYYTKSGFDSMINFGFPKNGNLSTIDSTYTSYASAINNDEDFNVLSYLSSHDHDDGIGVFGSSNIKNLATSLLLSPGGVQIYYGNELNRPLDWTERFGSQYKDQRYRSDMNWDNYDKTVLAHWQKLGRFRNKHLSVGAGQHEKLDGDVYTFSRTYHLEEEDEDKVVVALPGKAGTFAISVGDVFEDGESITDYYSGQKYEVSGGKVSVTCDANGVILLEGSGIVKPSVGAKAKGGDGYKTDTIDVTLKANKVTDTYYTIIDQTNPNGIKKAYTADQVIKIGGATAYDEETKLILEGKSEDGSTVKKEVTFKRSSEPIISDGLCVKVSKKDFSKAPYIYVYDSETSKTELNGKWPGAAMEDDGDSWSYTYEDEGLDSAVFILSQDGWRSTADMQPGITFTGGVEYSKTTGKTTAIPVGEPGRVDIKYVDESGKELKSIYRVGVVGKAYTTYPAEIDGYTLKETPSNATGTFATSGTVKYVYSNGVTPPPDEKEITIEMVEEAFTYDGTAKEPKVVVKEGTTELKKGTDYVLNYNNNVDAANADDASKAPTVIVKGAGTYQNNEKLNKTFNFTIQPKAINTTGITVSDVTGCVYTGKAFTPSVTIKDNDATIASSNYELSYSDNVHAGTAIITIKGKGNYTGELQKEFTIEKADAPANKPNTRIAADKDKRTLSQLSLPEGWQWKNGNMELKLGEEIQATVEYYGSDKDDYKTISVEVTVFQTDCNHEGTIKTEDKKATCVENGYTGRKICTKCDVVIEEGTVEQATGQHTGGTATCTKKKKCTVCNQEYGEIDSSKHTGGTATCVKGKVCTECGQEYGDKDMNNHIGGQCTENAVKATCMKEGYSGDICCNSCGEVISTGHQTAKMEHQWNQGQITTQPTATTDGVRTYTCEVCHTPKTETIAATGGKNQENQKPENQQPGNQTPGGQKPENQTPGNQTPGGQTPTDSTQQKIVYVTTDESAIESGDTITDSAKTTYRVTNDEIGNREVEYVVSRIKSEKVVVPDQVVVNGKSYKVTAVAESAFKDKRSLKSVEIGKNVEVIEKNAFNGCKNLSEVVVSGNVTTIQDKAFYKCNSLKSITIPSKVGKIGKQAFYGCKKLKEITIKSTKLTRGKIGNNAFKGIPSNATVKVPKSKLSAYKKLLREKGLSTKVKIKK
ncbi:MAG: alpha-amylase family glycosyl hydrolase [Clostridiales bacterium]|nr:alpha-amylase family glycosyl hydrolase [Clostridiales bacterium]